VAMRDGDGELHYAADLFTEPSARSLAEWFTRIVTAVAARPSAPLSRLPDRP
jgi:hypothetical protein